jgi:hypothetical protein
MKIPSERYDHDVMGMPVFAGNDPLMIVVGPNAMKNAVPEDDQHCAIARACGLQFESPYVSVGRSRTDVAMPHPKGVRKPGYGETLWAVIRFRNTPEAKAIIIAADTGNLAIVGKTIRLVPFASYNRPATRRERNKMYRKPQGGRAPRMEAEDSRTDALTAMGVRTLTGQRDRFTSEGAR